MPGILPNPNALHSSDAVHTYRVHAFEVHSSDINGVDSSDTAASKQTIGHGADTSV